ncbi:MAG: acetyl-CoA carboxylase biotin carboxyl carrier protein subunit, partial [Chloroflexota bacterium]|nr:acetyl-CoA carboxylase biotin carboxyl carrier protein subunit [Chloroflexota bacterium]
MKMKIMIDAQTYQVEIDDIHARPVIAVVDGERYEVWPEDQAETSLPELANTPEISVPEVRQASVPIGSASQGETAKEVISPLPGVIVAILVKPGDTVQHGQ